MSEISRILLEQRIRNRIIEFFELSISYVDIASFGAFETINMWYDWVDDEDERLEFNTFCEPVYVEAERHAIKRYHRICNAAADAIEDDIFSAKTLKQFPEWVQLQESAELAHELFMQRGKFSEDKEIF